VTEKSPRPPGAGDVEPRQPVREVAETQPADGAIVEGIGLCRDYRSGETVVHALKDVNLAVRPGELLAVRGRSGSGKTTLLNLLGGLDRPTSGHVVIEGLDVSAMSDAETVELRRRRIAFIFQTFGLIPILTAAENVEVPLRLVRTAAADREARVHELLELVGLAARACHRPFELSGGEQQRVAIARALANHPILLLGDEPTGQLDLETGRRIMQLLRAAVEREGVSAVVATHDPMMLDVADRVLELRDGMLVG
jgi:putative ABC transport system ATP-binding protein